MVRYTVTVHTCNRKDASASNDVFIKLVGTGGASQRTMLKNDKQASAFSKGDVSSFTMSCDTSLGKLVWIELDKPCHDPLSLDSWFLEKVEVKPEEKRTFKFPIYCWITDGEVHCFSEGTALRGSNAKMIIETQLYAGDYRQKELKERQKNYSWQVFKEGLPHYAEVKTSLMKNVEFYNTLGSGLTDPKLKELVDCTDSWKNIDDISCVFSSKFTKLSEYVQTHWRDDAFFGYQFLNGVNPMMIHRCTALPSNFPVTDDMLFLHGHSLADEMKKGNIFLCDFKNLDELKPNTINGKKLLLMAPLVLLHKTPDNKLMPAAIQLKQTPAEDNPIFVPTDPEYDWLLAKTFVRSADFNEHQLNSHLLRTHMLAEVFTVSLLRNVPMVHPLYKLLIPHTRYTLHINIVARNRLISDTGFFMKNAASGGKAMIQILQRSLSSLTYGSLCIHDDIADRGLESVPNFYYRDDGLRLWDIIHRFVQGILNNYYKTDDEVQEDCELQKWIGEIFEHGFLSNASTGIPQRLSTVDELVKFVTMVIFTCSAQHSAVNTGQFDYGGFMPNTPISLQLPPPTEKGVANADTLLQTLPAVNVTVRGMVLIWLLSKQSSDFVGLGNYPEEHFIEEAPCKLIKVFQGELKELSDDIKARNETLEVPYTYMDPAVMENSVAL